MTRYRVAHIITTFSKSSGAAENTKLTVNLLDRTRFDVFLATPPRESMVAELAPDVIHVPLSCLRRAINPFADLFAFIELYRSIRRSRFDVVHTHNAKDGILGRWAARLASIPAIVHTIHNVSFQASTSPLLNRHYAMQERLASRFTDRLLAVSTDNAAKYLRNGIGCPEQYRTVYSGLELARYIDDGRPAAERRAALGLPPDVGPWVAWVGRFNPQKDPLTFVRAAQFVKAQVSGVRFVVCGDDPIKPSLQAETRALVAELGLGEVMHFLGFRPDLTNVLRGVDVVMHSSRHEGMGRVICEALACERPVAGTAVDGVTEVIDSGRRGGVLVAPGDPIALAQAAVLLLTDQTLARTLARRGREWVTQNLSAQAMVRTIEQVYLELLTTTRT